jgi:hypothetical protein
VKLHIGPRLGQMTLSSINPPKLRQWRRELLDQGIGPVTVAKAHRLLRAIFNTAVSDRPIGRSGTYHAGHPATAGGPRARTRRCASAGSCVTSPIVRL